MSVFFFSSRRRHTRSTRDWSSDVCSSDLGAIFVEENEEVPPGSIVVFSAHGVAPEVHDQARERALRAIDATCPLVTKVHQEARRFAADDYDILLIGHEGHEEVIGTTGEAPAHIQLVDGPESV